MTHGETLETLLSGRSGTVVDRHERIVDVDERVSRVAGGLRGRGVGRGDRVAFQLPNVAAALLVYRACWRLGAVAVAVHPRAGAAELDPLLAPLDPVVRLTRPEEVASLVDAEPHPTVDARPDDDAVVLFTAGSTGSPKGVRHTHRSLAYKTRLMVEVHELTRTDVVLMPAPLSHISGLLNGVLVPGAAGMTTVLMDRWSPDAALDLIEREGVTFMVGPPTFFVDLLDAPTFSPGRVSSLRLVSSGGAGVTTEFVRRARDGLGALVKRSYGSTEAPTVATSLGRDDAEVAPRFDGHAIGDVELRIQDGELQVRGPELFAGYLSEAQTAEAMTDDGWYRTGDTATIDDDGWLTITGRLSEIVIRAGENISVREVQEALEAHPHVLHAAVVGVPHDRLGEQVAAAVVTDGAAFTVDDCRRWFEERGLTRFKTPEIVVTVTSLPRLPSGKLDVRAVRSIAAPG